jgi:hypothetical protein
LSALMNFFDCSTGVIINIAPAMIVQWQDVTDPNNTITYATQSISAGTATASYSISPYINLPGQGYTV